MTKRFFSFLLIEQLNKGIKVLSFTPFILFLEVFLNGGFDFALEDVAADDAVVGMVCFTVGGGVADGIFAGGEQAVDESFVLIVIREIEVHLVDFGNYSVPAVTPRFHRRAYIMGEEQIDLLIPFWGPLHVGHGSISCAADEGVEELVGADDALLDCPEADTVIAAVGAARLIIPMLQLFEGGRCQLLIEVCFHALAVSH